MKYQEFADSIEAMTCIISVKKFPDGGTGDIRIVTGNKAYIDSIENSQNIASAQMLHNQFIPDSPYEKYIPKDLNFEHAVSNCVFQKHPYHTYIHPDRYSFWMDIYMLPLASDDPEIGYCAYTMELTTQNSSDKMSNLSASASAAVLKTSLKLKGSHDIQKSVGDVLDDIREICNARRCCVLLTNYAKRLCSVLCQSVAPDERVISMEEYMQNTPGDFFDIVDTWQDTIAGSTCLIIRNDREMRVLKKRNPLWHDSLKTAGIKSLVLFPLTYNDEVLGYIWAVNFNTENADNIKEILELVTHLIAAEIANYQLVEQLRVIGMMDMLTGVYNRNAMNNRVDSITQSEVELTERFSVIFADLNGLKKMNDTEGHSAGDKLLKDAAKLLRESFKESEIYRAGGDEFMILSCNIPREELEMRVERLRRYSEKPGNVSFSLGLCCDSGAKDIRMAMRKADEQMYLDKERYYQLFAKRWRT